MQPINLICLLTLIVAVNSQFFGYEYEVIAWKLNYTDYLTNVAKTRLTPVASPKVVKKLETVVTEAVNDDMEYYKTLAPRAVPKNITEVFARSNSTRTFHFGKEAPLIVIVCCVLFNVLLFCLATCFLTTWEQMEIICPDETSEYEEASADIAPKKEEGENKIESDKKDESEKKEQPKPQPKVVPVAVSESPRTVKSTIPRRMCQGKPEIKKAVTESSC